LVTPLPPPLGFCDGHGEGKQKRVILCLGSVYPS